MTKITNWKAEPAYLEICIRIDPFGKYTWYYREKRASSWCWVEGTRQSGSQGTATSEVATILDSLVLEHKELYLFCHLYGIH